VKPVSREVMVKQLMNDEWKEKSHMQTNICKFWASRIMTSSLGIIEYCAPDLCYIECTLSSEQQM
jgi:hypothetical protein